MKNSTFLNLTPAFVSPNCAPRASSEAQKIVVASVKASDVEDEITRAPQRSEGDQAKRGRSAVDGRAAVPFLVTGLSAVGFTVPCPPSANKYWRTTKRGRTYVSPRAVAYKATVATLLNGMPPAKGDVSVSIEIYRPEKRGDLDNYTKVLLDALKGLAFVDDKQVVHLELWRHDDKHNPRAVIEVKQVPTEKAQRGAP